MDVGRVESSGASSFTEDSGDSADRCAYHYHDAKEDSRRISSSLSSSSLVQRIFSLWSCIILLALALGGIGNEAGLGLATAGIITLPVIRSYSQLEGSGAAVEGRSSSSSGDGGGGGMTLDHAQLLRDHDYQRSLRHHGRVLSTTVADFPLGGNDYEIGLYYTEIGLGTPSNAYYVQVDSGSDLLWVNCKPCPECPSRSDLQIDLLLYDPSASSTASNISCSSSTCDEVQSIPSPCSDGTCSYAIVYGDGSTAAGYLVQDTISYDTGVYSNESMTKASAKVVFGCGFNQTGESLTTNSRAVDGIMGFGRQPFSVVSQLAERGFTANEFAHCLQGDTGQGGIFVIGDVQEPGIVYTELLTGPYIYHYNVVLESISMGGVALSISPSVFDTTSSGDSGTIFDSGTTLAFLVDQAYDAFVSQLNSVAPVAAIYPVSSQPDMPCYQYSSNDVSSAFPSVTLTFQGSAAMDLVPTNYLYLQTIGSSDFYCLGWSKSGSADFPGLTILGDIVLKNKLVVYDLTKNRIGWVDYNCLASVKVGNGTGAEVVTPSDPNGSGSLSLQVHTLIAVVISSVVLIYAAAFL